MADDAAAFQAVPNEELAFLGTEPVPAAPYYDPAYYELEREAVFRRSWLHVGRVSEIAEPDGYIVRRIGAARASVLITRTPGGELRAFHNVCGHRGNELVWDDAGQARSFSCRYHRWTYGSDGTLRAVPDERRFFSLDKSACGLRPVAVDTCAGFLFVNLAPEPEQALPDYLGPVAGELDRLRFAEFTDFEQYHCDVAANWKTAFHNFQETYHVRWVHRPSSGGRATSRDNPFGYPVRYNFWGPHSGGTRWLMSNKALAEVQLKALRAAPPPPDAPARGCWDFYYLFPNLYLEPLSGGNPFTMQFWPTGPDRTRLVIRMYRRGTDQSAAMRFSREYSAATAARIRQRVKSQPAEREAFYHAARCCLDDGLRYLDGRPLDELTGADARLLDLILALTQVALAVELQRDAEPGHARVQARFVVERTSEDLGRPGPTPSATC